MYFLYNIAVYLGFLLLTPRFLYDKLTDGKWASGFRQRLGSVPAFDAQGRRVVLLHCVSVGEANAALPLAKRLREQYPEIALVVSTTTRTGQAVARDAYTGVADLVVYFPFDLGWSVKSFLRNIRPDIVLLTETELWFNFIRIAANSNIAVAIVNGRLSERSFRRYSRIKGLMTRVLAGVDLALMQDKVDADRITSLGIEVAKVKVTGNLKFDLEITTTDDRSTQELRDRFALRGALPLIIAASTHEPEERYVLESLGGEIGRSCRVMLVPRHPERFADVENLLRTGGYSFVKRSSPPSETDREVGIILLDSIGELRAAYPLADIVFVGGSLIPHGGQSVFEPAAAGKAIVTGPHTSNFAVIIRELSNRNAIRRIPIGTRDPEMSARLSAEFHELLRDAGKRAQLGSKAAEVIKSGRGSVSKTLQYLEPLLNSRG